MDTKPFAHTALFDRLFKENYAWLYRRLRGRLGDHDGAQDIAAETFLQALHLPDPTAIREPRALLTTIAKRLMYQTWRREDLEKAYLESLAHTEQACHPSPEEHHMLIEALLTLDKLLDGLPGQGKAAFIHRQFGGLTYEEIGQRLGLSAARVHQYMAQAYQCVLLALAGE